MQSAWPGKLRYRAQAPRKLISGHVGQADIKDERIRPFGRALYFGTGELVNPPSSGAAGARVHQVSCNVEVMERSRAISVQLSPTARRRKTSSSRAVRT